jgi:hypothetical protein
MSGLSEKPGLNIETAPPPSSDKGGGEGAKPPGDDDSIFDIPTSPVPREIKKTNSFKALLSPRATPPEATPAPAPAPGIASSAWVSQAKEQCSVSISSSWRLLFPACY